VKEGSPDGSRRSALKAIFIQEQQSSMDSIETFLTAKCFALAGASRDPEKYGNRILRALLASGRKVFPLNPNATVIEGIQAYESIGKLPEVPESLSIVTPPHVTRLVVEQAIRAGVKNLWMQPGAEDLQASKQARDSGLNVIDDGSCILVRLAVESRSRSQ
jgi:predicted CoA-binding protein